MTNPLAGLEPGTSLNSSTTTVEQLLAQFPEFPVGRAAAARGVMEQNLSNGQIVFRKPERARWRIDCRTAFRVIGNYMYLED